MLTFYQYCSYLIPAIFIFLKGYFLSVEFSLYPYLIQHGFLPYRDIIDQHFPTLFFGQFSLPYFLVNTPTKLLLILFFSTLASIFFLQETLKRLKVENYQIWTLIYSLLSIFFAINTLWVETFVVLFLSLCLFLNTKGSKWSNFFVGLLVSQIILMRPTLVIFLSLCFFVLVKQKAIAFLGFLLGFGLSSFYLFHYQLWTAFYEICISFNRQVYAHVQDPIITKRQIVSLVVLMFIFLFYSLKNKKWLYTFLLATTLLSAYPRFGLEHLQVFSFVFIYFLSQTTSLKIEVMSVFILCLVVTLPIWLSLSRQRYGNYFYPPRIFDQANKIKQLPGDNLYLYGSSDLLYQLSGKLPSGKLYLPSLPWYLNYHNFQQRLFSVLSNNDDFVVVDPLFTVDGQKLVDVTPQIYTYIKMNYTLDHHIDHLEVYKPKQ